MFSIFCLMLLQLLILWPEWEFQNLEWSEKELVILENCKDKIYFIDGYYLQKNHLGIFVNVNTFKFIAYTYK